jgi:hypothetical protein
MTTVQLTLTVGGMLTIILAAGWVVYRSTGRDRGMCEDCREHPATTVWAGSGRMICRVCCEERQAAYAADQLQRLIKTATRG